MASPKPEESNVMFLIALGLLLISLVSFFSIDVGLTVGPSKAEKVVFKPRLPLHSSLAQVEVTSQPPPPFTSALTPPPEETVSPFGHNFLPQPEAISGAVATPSTTSGGTN